MALAAVSGRDAPWLVGLKAQLADRDRLQTQAFASLIASQNEAYRAFKALEGKAASLEADNRALRDKVDALQRVVGVGGKGPIANPKEVEDLKAQLADYKERLIEALQKENAANKKLADLSEVLRKKDEEHKRQEEKELKLHDDNFNLSRQLLDERELSKNKDITNQVLHDELQALQLELINRNERLNKLEEENKQLLTRWLHKMNEEATKVNEANAFIQEAMQPKPVPITDGPAVSEGTDPLLGSARLRPAVVFIPAIAKRKITAHEGEINCIQAANASNLFATGSSDNKVKVFDTSGALKTVLRGATQSVMSVQFSRADDMILAAGNDNTTRLWHIESARSRLTFTGHIGKVFSAKFSPDSTKVISGSHDRTIKVWDMNRGYCNRTIFSYSSCNDLCVSDEAGNNIISGHLDNHIRFWDSRSGDCVKEITGVHSQQITSLTISPSGNEFLTNSRDNTLKLIDQRMLHVLHTYSAETYKTGMNWAKSSFSPDGAYIVAGSQDGSIFVWNTQTTKVERVLKGHNVAVAAVSWSANGMQMYSADKDKTVIIWEAD
eukprot:Unigene8564_Nuclearia_a/m.26226 Unigene8564_Nuclearia_a/g.26226  ORF Unigene8564_Nuclearia_a/g.26226 Unigene8564_Nuclearia_a/m.26226 type:complete len:554 (-) Unigene8564_Nuclearia_a:62-1723(-)